MANDYSLFHSKEEIENFKKEWERVTNMIKQRANVKVEVEVPTIEEIVGEKIDSLNELIDDQRNHCDTKYDIGIYNGLVLAKSVLTGEAPKYYEMLEREVKNNES